MLIATELAHGRSLRSICQDEGMPDRLTVNRWLLDGKHDEFRNQYEIARLVQADTYFDDIIEIADGTEAEATQSDDEEAQTAESINRARLRVDARKWVVSRLSPKRYGDKLGIGGADDLPGINVEPKRTDAETAVHLAKIFAGLAKQ